MPYKVIDLELTDEQVTAIRDGLGEGKFALIAQPHVRGIWSGSIKVYICTPAQYKILEPAVRTARQLPAYEK